MMQPPRWFKDQLDLEFDRQIRVRWSPVRSRWIFERKGPRRSLPRSVAVANRRMADPDYREQVMGNWYTIFQVAPGTITRCPACQRDVKLPFKEWRATKCECGRSVEVVFFPLGEDLLQRLRWSDPDRGGSERVGRSAEEEEARERDGLRRDNRNAIQGIFGDDYAQIAGIPQVGYTGKVLQ